MMKESEITLSRIKDRQRPELKAKSTQELLARLAEAGREMGRQEQTPPHERSFSYDNAEADEAVIKEIFAEREAEAAKASLVYLRYVRTGSGIAITVTPIPPPGLTLDLKKGIWSFKEINYAISTGHRNREWHELGDSPIGVYNTKDHMQLNNMISAILSAAKGLGPEASS